MLARAATERTMLTAFFKANMDDTLGPTARCYTYQEFPQHFVWKAQLREWGFRQYGKALGRMVFVSPNAGERYFLRLLLTISKGATSFVALRTVNGVVYNTFREACLALGLLEDDHEWHDCLAEAVEMQTGTLFCSGLKYTQNSPS